jgi:hypothetical protein
MNDRQSGMLTPALIGGIAAGILSAIPFLNCLCCLWIIGGAVLAAALLAKSTPVSLTAGDGAVVGALAGVTAAVVDAFISLPLRGINLAFMKRFLSRLAELSPDMPAGWDSWIDRSSSGGFSISMFILGIFISAVIFAAFGALGGVIGAALFKKKAPLIPPQGGADVSQDPGHRQP